MKRRTLVLPLVGAAAAAAVALPIAAMAAPDDPNLPDLRADPVENPELQVYDDGRLLLRFDGFVTNVGRGPLDIAGDPSLGDGDPDTSAMHQRIRDPTAPGGWRTGRKVDVWFETADGHNHFHLMKIMRYSLWNSDRSAEVGPGQKVGFCLYDIEKATGAPVTDPQKYDGGGDFCRQGNPGARDLDMGVSPGWRDVYGAGLALQWVDVTNVAPGEYYPAAQADPDQRIDEADRGNDGPAFMARSVTIPGYVATPVGAQSGGAPVAVRLAATTFGTAGTRRFRIESAPAHGTLNVPVGGQVSGDSVTYTPTAGYSGPDSFRFAALNTSGEFQGYPRIPATATASLQVGNRVQRTAAAAGTVSIWGAPLSLAAGTVAQLRARASGGGVVTWSASAGSITPAAASRRRPSPVPG